MRTDTPRVAAAEDLMRPWPPESDERAMDYLLALLYGTPASDELDEEWNSAADFLEAVADVVEVRRPPGHPLRDRVERRAG